MRRIILALALALWAVPVWADTHKAASCSSADVQTAINAASNGDTVTIPGTPCTWTTGVTVPAGVAITITGEGVPNTTPATTGASASCSATTITVNGADVVAFTVTPTYGNGTTRLSCFALNYGGTGTPIGFKIHGTCTASGCPSLRMDNLSFSNWANRSGGSQNGYAIGAIDNMFGVIDHNTMTTTTLGSYPAVELAHINLGSYLGVGHWGDKDWAMPENWGSDQFLFFENNVFSDSSTNEHEGTAGAYQDEGGGRLVARFNQFVGMTQDRFGVGWHGTESNGRPRGIHAYEVYNNTFVCADPTYRCRNLLSIRSGTGFLWGNATSGGHGMDRLADFTTYRLLGDGTNNFAPWGPCAGATGYDTNDATVYWSGTVSSVGSYTITVSGSPWTTNQWVDSTTQYSVHNVTTGYGGQIQSNTTDTLTVGWWSGTFRFSIGDSIQIRRPLACVDQTAGRGYGALYDDNYTPLIGGVANQPANQALVPTYVWSNTFTITPYNYVATAPANNLVVRNREFYHEEIGQAAQSNATTPFNGTTTIGMGHGTIANRPTTCTTGVGYWATDEGSWNQSGSGGQGRLYLCTATNTWTLSYTPYTYPHPLTSPDTHAAASCSRDDVATAVAAASDGDTVTIRDGSCTWTSGITVPVGIGITIKGAGTPNNTAATTGASASCSQTVITHSVSVGYSFLFRPNATSSLSRLSCLKFEAGSPTNLYSPVAADGTCSESGCASVRFDNLTFDGALATHLASESGGGVITTDNVFGVIDHNTMLSSSANYFLLEYGHSAWLGIGSHGDKSWSEPNSYGTANLIYLENNLMGDGASFGETEALLPVGQTAGGRVAARFNTCTGCITGLSNHGTESSGRRRGGRQLEFYANSVICGNTGGCQGVVPIRSGTSITFGNTINNRESPAHTWWNQYVAFSIYRIDLFTDVSPWLQCPGAYDQTSPVICLDQPNRRGGTYLSGSTPSPTGWSNQVLEPAYEWDNSGYNPVFGNVYPTGYGAYLQANRDWYTDNSLGTPQAQTSATSPFNGTSGVGFGTLARRPSTCTTGVGYWATDEGSWNTSAQTYVGGYTQGRLYTCTATDTWTLYYTPYTYPHPLISAGMSVPNAPTNVRIR